MKEISLHILDLAQNSVVAGASSIKIEIDEDTKADRFEVTLTDNGKGMSEEMAKSVVSPFVTTRTTRKVGLGIPLFVAGCQACDGNFQLQSKLGLGTTIKGWYVRSHIDRPPLGDIEETITLLIGANPAIRFYYRHRLDAAEYDLDTAELKDTLGEVPLDTPEVLAWIKDYLINNEAELYGGA